MPFVRPLCGLCLFFRFSSEETWRVYSTGILRVSDMSEIRDFFEKHGGLVFLGLAAGVVWFLFGHKTEAKNEPVSSAPLYSSHVSRSPARVVRRSQQLVFSDANPQAEAAAVEPPPMEAPPEPVAEAPAVVAPAAEQPPLAVGMALAFGGGGGNPGPYRGYGYHEHGFGGYRGGYGGYHGYGKAPFRGGVGGSPIRGGGARPAPSRGGFTAFRGGAVRSFAGRAMGGGRR